MSIASEIERIKSAKEALKNAINAKGGNMTTELLDDYAAAVSNLPTGSDIDVSFVTATADDILAGKVGADVNGNPVNGTIQTVTASLSGNVVTVPAGYHTANTLTVAEASAPTVSGNEVTVYKGYQATQAKVTVGVAKSADTITPGTTDVIIPAGTYLSGALIIKGDVNHIAENIKKDVVLFGITGTYEGECGGGGGSDSGDSGITTYNYSELDANGDAYVDSDQLSKLFVPVGEKVRIKVRFAAPDKDTIYTYIVALGSNLGLGGTMEDNIRLLTEDGTVKYTSYQDMPGEHVIKDSALPNGNYYIEIDNTDGTQQISMNDFNFNAYGDATGISDWVESGESGGDTPSETHEYVWTLSGAGTSEVNGDYWASDTTEIGEPVYINKNGVAMFFHATAMQVQIYPSMNDLLLRENRLYQSDGSVDDIEDATSFSVASGTSPAPTLSAYGSSSSGKTAVYRISGCSMSTFNGDYYATDLTSFNSNPVFQNDNGAYLYCHDCGMVPHYGLHPESYSASQNPTYSLVDLGPLASLTNSLNGMGFCTGCNLSNPVTGMTITVL